MTIGALVGAFALAWTAPALALTSITSRFTGTATGPGTVSRTITDVTEPNSPGGSPTRVAGVLGGSVLVPVATGTTANQIGLAFRDSINANVSLIATGYSAIFDPPADSSQVKMSRSTGSFTVADANSVPGVTMVVVQTTGGGGVQGPLASPLGLAILAVSLSALAYRERRRRR